MTSNNILELVPYKHDLVLINEAPLASVVEVLSPARRKISTAIVRMVFSYLKERRKLEGRDT